MQHVDGWKSLCSMSEQAYDQMGTLSSSDHIQSGFPKATKAYGGCQGCQKLGSICGCAGQRQERHSTSYGMLEKDRQPSMTQKLLPTKT